MNQGGRISAYDRTTRIFRKADFDELVAYNPEISYNLEERFVYIPTRPQFPGDTGFIDIKRLATEKTVDFKPPANTTWLKPGGAGSEVWNRVYMIAPVKKFGRVGLCTNFIPNKHGGGEEGELAELAVILFGVCVGSALFLLFQV